MNDNTGAIAIDLPTADWLLIDAVLDNLAEIAAEESDDETVAICEASRVKGLEQNPGWPTNEEELETWPEPGQRSVMRLTPDEWGFVVEAIEEDAEVSEQIAADPADGVEDADDDTDWALLATEARSLAAYISESLT